MSAQTRTSRDTPTGRAGYSPPAFESPIDLDLSRNECPWVGDDELAPLVSAVTPEILGRYPSTTALGEALGAYLGVEAERVVVTAGGDEAIERTIRLAFRDAPRRRALLTHAPSFEMLGVYTRNARRRLIGVPWLDGPFPIERTLAGLNGDVAIVALVTPNNPTGQVVPFEAIERVARRAADLGAICLVDLAYVEFAEEDPTARLTDLDNVVMIRTLSKAWGLAGLRVGSAIAPPPLASGLRAIGGPFPVSGVSAAIATRVVRDGEAAMRARVRRVLENRERLARAIEGIGGRPLPGQANFVFVRLDGAGALRDRLAGDGIAIRIFPNEPSLDGLVRITCPLETQDMQRLERALAKAGAGAGDRP